MLESDAHGNRLAAQFRLRSAPAVSVVKLQTSLVGLTRVRAQSGLVEKTSSVKPAPAFAVNVYLQRASFAEVWYCGQPQAGSSERPEGAISIIDEQREPEIYIGTPFDVVQFYLLRTALDEICRENGARPVEKLSWPFGEIDPVVKHMALSMVPALEHRPRGSNLFLDHAALAFCTYAAKTYGGMRLPSRPAPGRLAPWQERRAKEMLHAHVDGDVSLAQLAETCSLSRSHFARAFKQSTGLPPHRWLLARRVERAQDFLLHSAMSLEEIAGLCGFADQSHFTRVFARFTGVAPGKWRRQRRL